MSRLYAVGLNHRTAPVELRERLALPASSVSHALDQLRGRAGIQEHMLLSTCNRVELYAVSEAEPEAMVEALASLRGLGKPELAPHSFVRHEAGAARHIFRVAASLESLVLGEPQILGQVKAAYRIAHEAGSLGATLDRCLTMAFRGAKRARTETGMGQGRASVASVAVELAQRIFGELAGARVLCVGAGEMAELAAAHLRGAGCGELTVVNRGEARGKALAETVQGTYQPWDKLEEELALADIVISSTGAPNTVIGLGQMRPAMRRRRGRPTFLVDIAVPRDIDPKVSRLDGVYLYDVDDLGRALDRNIAAREAEADAAGRVIDEEVEAFLRWRRSRGLVPLITELQGRAKSIQETELERHAAKLAGLAPEQRAAVEALLHGVSQKLLYAPLRALNQEAGELGEEGELAGAARRLYDLGEASLPPEDIDDIPE